MLTINHMVYILGEKLILMSNEKRIKSIKFYTLQHLNILLDQFCFLFYVYYYKM